MSPSQNTLGTLKRGQSGVITRIESSDQAQAGFSIRLREMGFQEGATVEVIHEAPFGSDPIAVRVRGALIAIRRSEANLIWIDLK